MMLRKIWYGFLDELFTDQVKLDDDDDDDDDEEEELGLSKVLILSICF